MIQRSCNLSKTNSFFLFGPRGAGKTTLLHQLFSQKDSVFIDLLDVKVFDEFLFDLSRFEAFIDTKENIKKRVIINEIQKLPRLLDTVHSQIHKKKGSLF